jgi:hypothetical protein
VSSAATVRGRRRCCGRSRARWHPAAERCGGPTPAASATWPRPPAPTPTLTVEENLAFAATAYGVSVTEAYHRVDEYLERAGLAAARTRLAANLSGGMRQKLGVIRALVHRPDLLVLDEPTTGIDPVSRADLWWLIARASADGATVVLATTSRRGQARRLPGRARCRAHARQRDPRRDRGPHTRHRRHRDRPSRHRSRGLGVAARHQQAGVDTRRRDPASRDEAGRARSRGRLIAATLARRAGEPSERQRHERAARRGAPGRAPVR